MCNWNWNGTCSIPFHGTGISMFQFHSMELEFPCSIPFHGFHGFGVAQTGMELEFPVPFHVPLGSMGLGSSSIPVPCDPAEFHSSSIPCRPSSIPVPFQFHLVPWNWNGTGMELWKMEPAPIPEVGNELRRGNCNIGLRRNASLGKLFQVSEFTCKTNRGKQKAPKCEQLQ